MQVRPPLVRLRESGTRWLQPAEGGAEQTGSGSRAHLKETQLVGHSIQVKCKCKEESTTSTSLCLCDNSSHKFSQSTHGHIIHWSMTGKQQTFESSKIYNTVSESNTPLPELRNKGSINPTQYSLHLSHGNEKNVWPLTQACKSSNTVSD